VTFDTNAESVNPQLIRLGDFEDGCDRRCAAGERCFSGSFSDLPDPRQLSKMIYPLDEMLLLSLLAVLAEAETFTAIA
tara:strand:+ start:299 stop:532 length:234 start_codon:yes stop_codon:yes gene_type:complete